MCREGCSPGWVMRDRQRQSFTAENAEFAEIQTGFFPRALRSRRFRIFCGSTPSAKALAARGNILVMRRLPLVTIVAILGASACAVKTMPAPPAVIAPKFPEFM